uniref:Uncharacterized protein n=1 Tax=viral metagenome TaxID=1070528 RepID=A0A6C0IFX4_9ZZZZ
MEKRDLYNIGLIFVIGFFAYLIFRRMNYQEGFNISSISSSPSVSSTDGSGNITPPASSSNGIAGNSTNYLSQIKSQTVKYGDTFNIANYRTQYENIILSMDDLINNLMLQTVLTVDQTNPQKSLLEIGQLNNAKAGLNNVMKFIDGK